MSPVGTGTSRSVVMDDMGAEAVQLLLLWVYGQPLTDPSLTVAVALFQASDKYAIASLHLQCTRLLKGMLTYHNLYQLADLAQLHHSDDLLQVKLHRFLPFDVDFFSLSVHKPELNR